MAQEIEHKFLLSNENWREKVSHSVLYKQGYLSSQSTSSIRIRISDKQAWLNIKSATIGTQRAEYEYEIPLFDAHEILNDLCLKPVIEKHATSSPMKIICGKSTNSTVKMPV